MKSALISPAAGESAADNRLRAACRLSRKAAIGGTIKPSTTKWASSHFSINGQSGIDSNRPRFRRRRRLLLQRARPLDAGYDGAR